MRPRSSRRRLVTISAERAGPRGPHDRPMMACARADVEQREAKMALELRPNCEYCDVDLPPAATEARICSYECTFCAACVEQLQNVCPNCGHYMGRTVVEQEEAKS